MLLNHRKARNSWYGSEMHVTPALHSSSLDIVYLCTVTYWLVFLISSVKWVFGNGSVLQVVPTVFTDINGHTIQSNQVLLWLDSFDFVIFFSGRVHKIHEFSTYCSFLWLNMSEEPNWVDFKLFLEYFSFMIFLLSRLVCCSQVQVEERIPLDNASL